MVLGFSVSQFFFILIILIDKPILLFLSDPLSFLGGVGFLLKLVDSLLELLGLALKASVLSMNVVNLLDMFFAFRFKFFDHLGNLLFVAFDTAFEGIFGLLKLLDISCLALNEKALLLKLNRDRLGVTQVLGVKLV